MKKFNHNVIKVCHIISADLWGGAEAQAYSLIKGMSKQKDINIRVIIFNYGQLYSKIISSNINLNIVEENKNNILSMILETYRILKLYKIDIIHTHGFKENYIGGIAAKALQINVVRTHHGKGMIEGTILHKLIEKINEKFLTNDLIAVSCDLKELLVSKKYNKNKIHVIRNGLDCIDLVSERDHVCIKNILDIESDAYIIGNIGRLVSVKNHRCLLDGANIILQNYKNVHFLLVGDGPLKEVIYEYAKSLGIDKRLKMIGFHKNIIDILKTFDIFALTSLHEGIPMSLLEAMCIGIPTVTTRVGGIPEVIVDNYNGLLIPPDDPVAFSKACISLLENNMLAEKLARNAKQDMKSKYSLNNTINKTVTLYHTYI